MGIESILAGIVAILAVVIPAFVLYLKRKRSIRDAVANTEATELGAGMDRVDKLYPPDSH